MHDAKGCKMTENNMPKYVEMLEMNLSIFLKKGLVVKIECFFVF